MRQTYETVREKKLSCQSSKQASVRNSTNTFPDGAVVVHDSVQLKDADPREQEKKEDVVL